MATISCGCIYIPKSPLVLLLSMSRVWWTSKLYICEGVAPTCYSRVGDSALPVLVTVNIKCSWEV